MINMKVRKSKRVYTDSPYSIFVTFPYNQKIVDTIRTIEGRKWNSEKKEWELPITGFETLIVNLPEFDFEINGYVDFSEEENEAVEIPANFSFKTNPFKHQVEGFEYGLSHNNWLLGDEQGLGKTKQVIDIAVAKKLALGYKHCLIVCGVNGLKWNWVEEIKTHSNEQAYILGQRQRAGKTIIGSTADKLNDIMSLFKTNDNTPYFIITNVESLRNEQIVTNLKLLCQKGIINIVAADEIHKCFDYNTMITTDWGKLSIGSIVTNKLPVNVLSYNETTGEVELKPVVNWFENTIAEKMIELTIETDSGEIKTIKCTRNHRFYTKNREWVEAQDLTEADDLVDCS